MLLSCFKIAARMSDGSCCCRCALLRRCGAAELGDLYSTAWWPYCLTLTATNPAWSRVYLSETNICFFYMLASASTRAHTHPAAHSMSALSSCRAPGCCTGSLWLYQLMVLPLNTIGHCLSMIVPCLYRWSLPAGASERPGWGLPRPCPLKRSRICSSCMRNGPTPSSSAYRSSVDSWRCAWRGGPARMSGCL